MNVIGKADHFFGYFGEVFVTYSEKAIVPLVVLGLRSGQLMNSADRFSFTQPGTETSVADSVGRAERLGAAAHLLETTADWKVAASIINGISVDGLPPTTLNAFDLMKAMLELKKHSP